MEKYNTEENKMVNSAYAVILRNRLFFGLVLCFLIVGAVMLGLYAKGPLFLMINQYNGKAADSIFKLYTHVGDGMTAVVVILIAVLFSRRNALLLLGAFLLSSLVSYIVKKIADMPRPHLYLHGWSGANWPEGDNTNLYNSFPSGHTTTAFMLATLFALLSKDKKMSVLYFALALLVGYSRIYLGQHFFADVYVGSMIGTLSSLFIYLIYLRSDMVNNVWWEKPLFKFSK